MSLSFMLQERNGLESTSLKFKNQLEESNNLVKYYKELLAKKDASLSESRSMIFQLESSLKNSDKSVEDQSMVKLYQNKFAQVLDEKRKLEKELKERKKRHASVLEQLKKIDLESTDKDVRHQKITTMTNTDQDLVNGLHEKIIHLKSRIEKAKKADELEAQLKDLKSKLDASVADRDKNKDIIAELQKEILKNSGQYCLKTMQVKELEVLLDQKEVALKNLTEKYDATLNEFKEMRDSHVDKLNLLNDNISTLQDKLNLAVAEKQSLEASLIEKNNQVNIMESQLSGITSELSTKLALISKYREDLNLALKESDHWACRARSLNESLSKSQAHEISVGDQLENKNAQLLELELKYQNELKVVEELEARLSNVVETSGDVNSEVIRLRAVIDMINTENDTLTKSSGELQNLNSEYIGKIDDLKGDVSRLTDAFNLLKEHDDEIEKALEDLKNENFSLQESLKKSNEELETAKFQVALVDGLRDEVKTLKDTLEKTKTFHEEKINSEKMHKNVMHESIELLANELDKVRHELKTSNDTKTSLETQLKTSNDTKASLEIQLNISRSFENKLNSELSNTRNKLNHANSTNISLEIQLNQATENNKLLETQLKESKESFEKARKDLQAHVGAIEISKNEYTTLCASHVLLTRQLTEVSAEKDSAVKMVSDLQKEKNDLLAERDGYGITCEVLRSRVKTVEDLMKGTIEGLKIKYDNCETEKLKAYTKIDELKSTMEQVLQENESLQTKYDLCHAEKDRTVSDVSTLNHRIETHESLIKELKERNTSLETQLKNCRVSNDIMTQSMYAQQTASESFKRDMENVFESKKVEWNSRLATLEKDSEDLKKKNETLKAQLEQYESDKLKTVMKATLDGLVKKVPMIPEFNSPENEEWEVVDDSNGVISM